MSIFLKSPSKFFFLNKIFDYSLISMLNFIQKKILLGKPKIYFAPNIKAYKKYKKIKKLKLFWRIVTIMNFTQEIFHQKKK